MRWSGSVLALLCWLSTSTVGLAQDKKTSEFSRTTIDLGVVVSDIEKSVKFYTEAAGFQEIQGFNVPGDFAKEVGLTDGKPLKVRVLVLGDEPTATKLKLIQFPDSKAKKNDSTYIDSEYGFRYLTIFVTDTNATLARLQKAGVKPIAQGTKQLPEGLPRDLYLTIVRDPDGNLVEFVGPKK